MKIRFGTITLPGAIALISLSPVEADEPPRLSQNPFSRPPSAVIMPERPLLLPDGSRQPLELRATLVASKDTLANVAGKVLRPGDEVQGYTLVRVFEDRAVFTRAGDRLTIYVKPNLEKVDE